MSVGLVFYMALRLGPTWANKFVSLNQKVGIHEGFRTPKFSMQTPKNHIDVSLLSLALFGPLQSMLLSYGPTTSSESLLATFVKRSCCIFCKRLWRSVGLNTP